ncbi:MAG: hypothetical protein AAGC55_13085 [Myxococcota bacterium]
MQQLAEDTTQQKRQPTPSSVQAEIIEFEGRPILTVVADGKTHYCVHDIGLVFGQGYSLYAEVQRHYTPSQDFIVLCDDVYRAALKANEVNPDHIPNPRYLPDSRYMLTDAGLKRALFGAGGLCERLKDFLARPYVYVASSWRNPDQPRVVAELRATGYEVYDFREDGFSWADIDPEWKEWTSVEFIENLEHPLAVKHFERDFRAMERADAFVMVMTCGRSAHIETGWGVGRDKPALICLDKKGQEPELMYRMADSLCIGPGTVVEAIGKMLERRNG